ncbi:Lysine-specific demethylase 3B, partial [Coemansia sp. RSA 2320]
PSTALLRIRPALDLPPQSTELPRNWSKLYSLFMTAPTLLATLLEQRDIIATSDVVSAAATAGRMDYGELPGYECSANPCVFRNISAGSRHVCDMCATTVLSAYFVCDVCGVEMCPLCFREWTEGEFEHRTIAFKGISYKQNSANPLAKHYDYCKMIVGISGFRLRLGLSHKKRQFIRVSHFTATDISAMLDKTRAIVDLRAFYPQLGRLTCNGAIGDAEAVAFAAKIDAIERRTRDTYPHAAWELPVLYVADDELTTAEFSLLWRQGRAIVVRGLLNKLNSAIWKPRWWIEHFGKEPVTILDCAQRGAPAGGGDWPLANFYWLFDGPDKFAETVHTGGSGSAENIAEQRDEKQWARHRACVERGILKLKDWPPTDDFERRLPTHFRRFMSALPFREYTQRDGQFNLVNRLPGQFLPPDLGPKMYCAYGSSDGEGGVGTTNLHCDMADAVNIMAYAPPEFLRRHNIEVPGIWTRADLASDPGGQGSLDRDDGGSMDVDQSQTLQPRAATAAAVWDIYPDSAVGDLRRFIGNMVGIPYTPNCAAGPTADEHGDAIHNQETYLTLPMREEFFNEYGRKCYRIYQIPGDAVFVPAGCPHQVCNYSSAVKIAMDFVSPERVEHCRRLTEEFRHLSSNHPRHADLLQLCNIMWWAFAGKQTEYLSRVQQAKSRTKSSGGANPHSDSDDCPATPPAAGSSAMAGGSAKRPRRSPKGPAASAASPSKGKAPRKATAREKGKGVAI